MARKELSSSQPMKSLGFCNSLLLPYSNEGEASGDIKDNIVTEFCLLVLVSTDDFWSHCAPSISIRRSTSSWLRDCCSYHLHKDNESENSGCELSWKNKISRGSVWWEEVAGEGEVPLEHWKHRNEQGGAPLLKTVFEWRYLFPSSEASGGGAAKKGAKKKGSSFQTVSALFRVRTNCDISNYLRNLASEVWDHTFQETLEKGWRLWLLLIWNGRDLSHSDISLSHLSC